MTPTKHGPSKPLSFPVAFPDVPGYLVVCNVTRETAHEALRMPHVTAWEDGLGDCAYWAFEYPCGLQVVYQLTHSDNCCLITADSPEVNHALRHCPFNHDDCRTIDDAGLADQLDRLLRVFPDRQQEIDLLHAFQVWRQDDHGNSFKIGSPTSERDAKCCVQQFESRGHKQTYWYARV